MDMIKPFALALMSMSFCASAMAVDMDYSPPDASGSFSDETPVLLGSGWYLRGDVGGAREYPPTIGEDIRLGPAMRKKNGAVFSMGAGYQFNSWFRTDLTVDYRNSIRTSLRSAAFDCTTAINTITDDQGAAIGIHGVQGSCYSAERSVFKRTALMFNAYLDLGTWSFGVTPYVGGGVGATYGRLRGSYNWFTPNNGEPYGPTLTLPANTPQTWYNADGSSQVAAPSDFLAFGAQNRARTGSQSEIAFTWALMGGVAVKIADNTKLDVGYRYVNSGNFAKGGPNKEGDIHEYRAGIRYVID